MKLEGLRILEAELSATLSLEGITVKVFYFFADKWHDLVKEEECKPGIYALLSAAKGRMSHIIRPVVRMYGII